MDIKVGDRFEWVSKGCCAGEIYQTVRQNADGSWHATCIEGHCKGRSDDYTLFASTNFWRRVTPAVKPGQRWRVCDGVYTVACRSKNGLGWDCMDDAGQPHPYMFSDLEVKRGLVTMVPTEVKLGQVWRREMDSQKFRITSLHRSTGWWNAESLDHDKQAGYFYEQDGTLPGLTLVSDAPADPVKLAIAMLEASKPRITPDLSNLIHDREIAAKMQAHNDAFAERHKQAIKDAWAATSQHWTPSDYGPTARVSLSRGMKR